MEGQGEWDTKELRGREGLEPWTLDPRVDRKRRRNGHSTKTRVLPTGMKDCFRKRRLHQGPWLTLNR